jgi:hypothetical protein
MKSWFSIKNPAPVSMKKIPYYSRFGLVYNTIWSDEELAYVRLRGIIFLVLVKGSVCQLILDQVLVK